MDVRNEAEEDCIDSMSMDQKSGASLLGDNLSTVDETALQNNVLDHMMTATGDVVLDL